MIRQSAEDDRLLQSEINESSGLPLRSTKSTNSRIGTKNIGLEVDDTLEVSFRSHGGATELCQSHPLSTGYVFEVLLCNLDINCMNPVRVLQIAMAPQRIMDFKISVRLQFDARRWRWGLYPIV
jgi:hypothetical protein